MKNHSQTVSMTITGLDCAECALTLERGMDNLAGIDRARVNFALAKMTLDYDPQRVERGTIVKRVRELGYDVSEPAQAVLHRKRRLLPITISGLFIALALVSYPIGAPALVRHVLYAVATVIAGYPSARAAWAALRTAHSLDMNVLMSLAAIGAMIIGEFEEGAVVTFLFSLGNLLEEYTMDRARNAIRALMDLTPPQATRLSVDGETVVGVEALAIGDRILVRPGERIPMDGRVLEGRSAVDQAPITGESLPVPVEPGSGVFAGTINGSGALTIQVTHLAADNTLSRIIQMVEQAQSEKAPSQRIIDRFARIYTPTVVIIALAIALAPPLLGFGQLIDWFYRALVLLVIACPCALVISTPVTIVSGIARAARAGVLIKGGAHLEQAGTLKVIAFDKTGTLTRGRPVAQTGSCTHHDEENPDGCQTCRDLLAKAAAIESRSEHPLAQAIIGRARDLGVAETYPAPGDVEALPGVGILGSVNGHQVTVSSHAHAHPDRHTDPFCDRVAQAEADGQTVIMIEDRCCDRRGYVAVADTPRDGASQVIADLHQAGIEHTLMLTGDHRGTARAIASAVGVDAFRADLLPEHKVAAVSELLDQYGQVGMVGDGVNDAPALARATLGIVMGAAGSDAALETADVALMADDLTKLPFTIRLSRRALAIIRQNVAFSLAIKAAFLALALTGHATLWMAVFADMGASLLVTINGMRALGYRE